jgi:imidazolonepropionase-like amidohydrolase
MMVEAGLPPVEALLDATSRAANFIIAKPSFGTIEVGKSADLLLVDGDPLQDISVTQKLVTVMARGHLIERLPPAR